MQILRILFVFPLFFLKSSELLFSQTSESFFDCDFYNYFSDTALPVILKEDSIKIIRYLEKYRKIKHDAGTVTFKGSFHNFIPYASGYYDTLWLERLGREANYFRYLSLDYSDVVTPIASDGLILGRIIEKRMLNDTSKCYYFKTEYVIEVMDVIHAYFPLTNGDKVLIKDTWGYGGGCFEGGDKVFSTSPHVKTNYKIGEESLFILHRNGYKLFFTNFSEEKKQKFQDEYCPQAFRMFLSNDTYNDNIDSLKLNDLKVFFNTEFKNANK